MPQYEYNGIKIHYQIEGSGYPLTLVHGVGADLESWDGVTQALLANNRYRVLRMDLRGHGRSSKTPGPYTLAMFSTDLQRLLVHTGIEKTHLAGFSLGGLIAQQFALDHEEKLQALAIISSVANRTAAEQTRVRQRAKTLQQAGAIEHLSNAVERWFTDEFRRNHPEVLEWRRRKSLQNDPQAYAAAYQVLAESELGEHLSRIAVPTLAMTGENDIGSTPRMSRFIASTVQNGQCRILPKLKHSVLLEAPELIAAELNSFF